MPQERKLAAIMFTDIVGYTALMGSNETKAFELLRKNRNIQKPIISKYKGKWLKEMGDGILASFDTASDAVRCAGEIQNKAEKEGIGLRIGIHLGEVVFEGGDVLGDGVNVASRLEEIAEAGNIYISGAIYNNVKNKEGITTEFLGDKTFKNVDEPVNVYKVQCEVQEENQEVLSEKTSYKRPYYIIGGVLILIVAVVLIWQYIPKIETHQPSIVESSDKTIAVLPFKNDSPDPDNEYFCNGMMEEILNQLQKISDLKVKSRTAVEPYRNTSKTFVTIAKELNVNFIVEGSVRKSGEDLRITSQLIDVKTGDHLWSETYDGKYTEKIFEFQGEVAHKVASSLKVVITPAEMERIEKKPTANITTYDFMLRARDEVLNYWIDRDTKHLKLAHKLINRALELDPQYLEALAIKGGIYIADLHYDSAFINAKKILEIDPMFSRGYIALGEYFRVTGNIDNAIKNYQLALKYYKSGDLINRNWIEFRIGILYCIHKNDYLNGLPYLQRGNDPEANRYAQYGHLSLIFFIIGDYKRAEMYNNEMLETVPETMWWYIRNHTNILFSQGKFKQSINFLDSICSVNLSEETCNRCLFEANVFLEDYEQAEQYYNQSYEFSGLPFPADSIMFAYTIKKLGKEQESFVLLNQISTILETELQKGRYFWVLVKQSLIHAILGEKEESMRYLTETVNLGQGSTFFTLLEYLPIFENFRDDPDFKAIIKQNNEKLEKVQVQINKMRERGEISF